MASPSLVYCLLSGVAMQYCYKWFWLSAVLLPRITRQQVYRVRVLNTNVGGEPLALAFKFKLNTNEIRIEIPLRIYGCFANELILLVHLDCLYD